jgi:hypothetical protein
MLTHGGLSAILPPVLTTGGRDVKTTAAFLSVLLAMTCIAGHASDQPTDPQENILQTDRLRTEREGGPMPFPEQVVVGKVTTAKGDPIGGVAVKLFADGMIVEVSHTTQSGDYEMRLPLSVESDETVVIWFIATSGDFMPQSVVLKKSRAASGAGLFSECTPETRMRPQMRVDAILMTEGELAASLKARGCL